MVDVVTFENTQESLKQGLCVALPISKERLQELKKNKEKSLLNNFLVKKDAEAKQ